MQAADTFSACQSALWLQYADLDLNLELDLSRLCLSVDTLKTDL